MQTNLKRKGNTMRRTGLTTPAMRAEATERHRTERRMIGADELMRLARDAARAVMAGLSLDDRDDCAAAILADGIAALPLPERKRRKAPAKRRHATAYHRALAAERSAMAPNVWARADDPSQSFTAYRNRARTYRRKVLERDKRERADCDAAQNLRATDGLALVRDLPAPEDHATSHEYAHAMADHCAWRLSQAPHSAVDGRQYANVWTLLYAIARAEASAVTAHDLGLQPSTLRKRESRGAASLAERYPSESDLIDALCADLPSDATEARHRSGRTMARDWRTGTDGGTSPQGALACDCQPGAHAPDCAAVALARSLCAIRSKVGGRRKSRPMTERERAESLTRLSRAQYRAMGARARS